jgi:rubrerythrin
MRNPHLMEILKDQLDHEEKETEIYARKVRETKHSVVKLVYGKLMRDSMQHAEVLNCAIGYLATNQWEALAPVRETREEMLQLMEMEEKALRLFTSASTEVDNPHLKSLLTMLALDEEQHYAMLRYVLENFVGKKGVIQV